MSDTISRDELDGLCDEYAQSLAAMYPGDVLPPEAEALLAPIDRSTAMGALRYFATLKALYVVRAREVDGGASPVAVDQEDAAEAARQLLSAEPVRFVLTNGRRVHATDRSLTCLYELLRHHRRIKLLNAMLDDMAGLFARLVDRRHRLPVTAWARRRQVTQLMAAVEAQHKIHHDELLHHLEQVARHALTASGAPAREDEPAPDWWQEMTPVDAALLVLALFEAGPGRYHRLGPVPETKSSARTRGQAVPWDLESVAVGWGIRTKIPPAEVRDRRVGQFLTEIRKATPPSLADALDA